MTIQINDPDLVEAIEQSVATSSVSVESFVSDALREKLAEHSREASRAKRKSIDWNAVDQILQRFSELPVLDSRTPDEILGYNEFRHFDK